MEVGLVHKIDIDDEMQQAYLDYAMSVIVSRALPDARDGLKPVHRRILYAMYDMGLRPDTSYKKSARIVGEVLGKYHPHGDMAVYDAMARMAQDFSMRLLMVDGQGNFGSIDGDPPAAMRYTEARLAPAAMEIINDIQRNTVDFESNFDDTLREPSVLPAAIPNLLVNGATGIAVGMSTSIPPHNLGEVIDALKHLLLNWEKLDDIGLEDIMHFIQGPDFPTGGLIVQEADEDSISSAYGTGRGRVSVQARAHLEEMERGRNRIIVTELPYMTNKASLIERIADLVREERLNGIADLRDESDRQGMRIVIELTKTAEPQAVLRDLYKHTPMQSTFSIIMLALVDGEPRMLTIKQALRVYLEHRLKVIRRRSEFELERARQRAHILEGLRVALNNLDEIIALIRRSPDVDTARKRLKSRYRLTDIQTQAILDMQLRRLASLERKKIELEYKELLAQIKDLETLLASPKKIRLLAAEQLESVKQTFGDRRRTQIVQLKDGTPKQAMLTAHELIPEQTVWLTISPTGLVSRAPGDKTIRRSGSEAPMWLLRANTRDTLYLVNEQGEAASLPLANVPETDKPSLGVPYHQLSALRSEDRLAAVLTLPPKGERAEEWYVLTATRQGMVKKSALADVPGPTAGTFTLVRVNEGDQLGWIRLTDGSKDVLLLSQQGMAIRFNEADVRPMGLVAAGVLGMKLKPGDEVVGLDLLPGTGEVFIVASDGTAKRIRQNQFPRQGRYGQGVVAWRLPGQTHAIGIVVGRSTLRVTLHLDKLAPKMNRLDDAPTQGRSARGKPIQEIRADDTVVYMSSPWEVERPLKTQTPRTTARKTTARKTTARKTTTRKTSAQKTAAQKTTPQKTSPQKTVSKKTPAKKSNPKPVDSSNTARKAPPSSRSTTRRSQSAGIRQTDPKPTPKTGPTNPSKSQKSNPTGRRKSSGRRGQGSGSK